jgi:hypothetical protein
MDKKFISIREFVAQYPFSRTATYELLKNGSIDGIKVGRRTFIDSDSAAKLLTQMPNYKPRKDSVDFLTSSAGRA